jgi:hypothetical protein
MKIESGGGITSNKYVTSSKYKSEPVAQKASPAGAAQQGMATQFRKEPLIQGHGYEPGKMAATGVGKATARPDTPGPGSGRTTYASGSQGSYGPAARGETNRAPDPPATKPGVDILSQFGPEVRRGR